MDFDFDNLLDDLEEIAKPAIVNNKAETNVEIEEEKCIFVPLDYRIFSTHNNEPTGQIEPIDTYNCDRTKGIVPIGKARIKADLMKKAFKTKVFFVEETSSKISENGKAKTVHKIVYQTK